MSAAAGSKRKRPSVPATPADSPAKRRTTRGGAGSAAAAADPPTLVPVEGQWSQPMRRHREVPAHAHQRRRRAPTLAEQRDERRCVAARRRLRLERAQSLLRRQRLEAREQGQHRARRRTRWAHGGPLEPLGRTALGKGEG